MFDVGFSEILVIAVVALVVIGPERLPKTARTLGHLFGRLQRYVSDVKADISREMELEELRKLKQQVQTAAQEIQTSVSAAASDFQSGVRSVEEQLNAAGSGAGTQDVTTPPAALTQGAQPSASDSAAGAAPSGEPAARQTSLPGFDKI